MAKTYTAAGTVSAGDVATAAAFNVVTSDINNLIVPPACLATASATINVANNTLTAITFPTERFDTDSIHDTSTNTSRFTITTSGIYQMSFYGSWNGSVAGAVRDIFIRLNGITYFAQSRTPQSGGGIGQISSTYDLTSGDYVEFVGNQDSGVTMTLSADRTGSVVWIGRIA